MGRAGQGGWGGTDDENIEVLVEADTEGEDAGQGDDTAHEVDIGGARVPAEASSALPLPGRVVVGPCVLQQEEQQPQQGQRRPQQREGTGTVGKSAEAPERAVAATK